MNFGFNSNVRVGSALYHVQTEDRGPSHPFLDTVVCVAGLVVHKRSTSYQDLAGSAAEGEDLAQQVHERLAQQHREVIAQLEAGTLPLKALADAPAPAAAVASYEGLDVRLLNPKSWLASGNATLEVELRRRGSAEEIGGADIEAFLESEKARSTPIRASADVQGRATLKFPLPSTVADGTALVIRATDGDLYGELRFRLRARRGDAPAALPSK
jgi:hypothetical protein